MQTAIENPLYCNSLTEYSRWQTREVMVGKIGIGGQNPIRIQSMTTTDTMDTQATVEQSIRMIEAGCELVRITAPSIREARNLENIKNELAKKGFDTPLIADIHYTPNAAEIAAAIVEKVRINPGNYIDKKKFQHIEYSDREYDEEIARIRERFSPLAEVCKKHGTAMRIGANHGSLSDRIMSRYGDTPKGMAESALEFLRICNEMNYHEIILSMKASNVIVMVQAYRLLVSEMKKEGFDHPIHLGVTEAGEGEDGRIKSAIGIGALLEDGIGDTIRVSLTEEPELEIPVARNLVKRYDKREQFQEHIPEIGHYPVDPFIYTKRKSITALNLGGNNVPRYVACLSNMKKITPESLAAVGYVYDQQQDKWNIQDQACDYIYSGNKALAFDIPGSLGVIYPYPIWKNNKGERRYPSLLEDEYMISGDLHSELNFITLCIWELSDEFIDRIKNDPTVILVIHTDNEHAYAELRACFALLIEKDCQVPVIINRAYKENNEEEARLYASMDIGALLADGLGDGVWLEAGNKTSEKFLNQTCFGILQATRTRISKTEYISCPSCGRTLFDLQETTAKIREKTSHLKGVKIGIMGCIVNGPGEMADADYGYVGTGQGKITLCKGKEVVRRNVPTAEALDALTGLIKVNGDWVEPPVL